MSSTDRARLPTLLAGLSLALGACAGGHAPPPAAIATGFDPHAKTALDQYRITVEQRPEELALSVHARGLSANQGAALAAYADSWRQAGGDAVITVPPPPPWSIRAAPRAAFPTATRRPPRPPRPRR